MATDPVAFWRSRSIDEQVVAAALGGAALLLAEVRFEHREVLGETWAAWLPLGCAALLCLGGGAALLRFRRGGRRVLSILFGLAFAVGAVGIWFHSGGHPLRRILQVFAAFALEPGKNGGIKIGSEPPVLAPAAFLGLGVIGLIACLRRDRDGAAGVKDAATSLGPPGGTADSEQLRTG